MSDKAKNIILIVLGVLLLALIGCSIYLYTKYKETSAAVEIWNDSTYYYKNKYNEEYLAKNTYILKADLLKEYSDSLYKEYQSLKDHPVVITRTTVITLVDTVKTVIDSIWNENESTLWAWHAQDSCWYEIEGFSKVAIKDKTAEVLTNINRLIVNTDLTLDVVDNGTLLAVIAKANNPYTNIGKIESVVIDPTTSPTIKKYFKPKRWGFGPYIGLGVYSGWGYGSNLTGLLVGLGLSIGFSVHYDLVQW